MFEQSSRRFLLPALLATVLAFTATATASPQSLPLSCDGPFARDSSEARLKQYFSARNVSWRSVYVGEGEFVKTTVLFAGDKKREAIVYWLDRKHRRNIDAFEVWADPTSTDSLWREAHGISIGSSLASVEAINGHSFTLSGFDWDYPGGAGPDYGGVLDEAFGPCVLKLFFTPTKPETNSHYSNDGNFSSSDPGMRALFPVVYRIGLVFRSWAGGVR